MSANNIGVYTSCTIMVQPGYTTAVPLMFEAAMIQIHVPHYVRELIKPGTRNKELGNDGNWKQEMKKWV